MIVLARDKAKNVRQTAAGMAMLQIAVNSQVHRHTIRIRAIKMASRFAARR